MTVTFVCLGNICRSPMGEFIFREMLEREGLCAAVTVNSFGTSSCEEGSPIYPPALRCLAAHGITASHSAKKISPRDVGEADFVLCMDGSNKSDLLRLTGGEYKEKIFRLCDFTARPRDVADPWYTLDFERAYKDITDGCRAFLNYLKSGGLLR